MTMKDHAATACVQASAEMEHATVKACTDAGLIIHGPNGVSTGQVATGCLIEPMAGDRVLVSRSEDECFILAVLARTSDERTINAPGRLTVRAQHLDLRGEAGSVLASHGSTEISGRQFKLRSTEARVHAGRMSVIADSGEARISAVRLIADRIETVSDRIAQCARQVIRRVEEVESLQAGNVIQRIRENLFSRSKRVSLTASKDVHVDGERIHMG